MYKNCQSCGVPLKRDDLGGGTETDGTKSKKFCSHCYRGGKFVLPDISAAEMKERVTNKLRDLGFPRLLASFFARGTHKLERWAKSSLQLQRSAADTET